MAPGCTTRVIGVCMALLLTGVAHAALLTDTESPDGSFLSGRILPGIQGDSAVPNRQLLASWSTGARPSGTAGGALSDNGFTWSLEPLPTLTSNGQGLSPEFELRPMLGGLSIDLQGRFLDDQQNPVTPVPLPGALWLLGSGTLAVGPLLRRRTRRVRTREA